MKRHLLGALGGGLLGGAVMVAHVAHPTIVILLLTWGVLALRDAK